MGRQQFSQLWVRLPRVLRRLLVVSASVVLFSVGMIFSVLPGPGIPFLIAGLATLAVEFAWARTYLEQLRHHAERIRTKSSSYLPRRSTPKADPSIENRSTIDHDDNTLADEAGIDDQMPSVMVDPQAELDPTVEQEPHSPGK